MPLRDISLAVLDILGFGAMVRSQADVESFRESYLSVFRDDAVVSVAEPLAVRYHIYSDTIVIGSLADGPIPGIVNLFCFCRFLWTWALLRAFPLRGAVAYGKVLWDDDVKVGVPIEEAARAEEDQQWVGIMVCPSVLAKLHEDLNHEHTWKTLLPNGFRDRIGGPVCIRKSHRRFYESRSARTAAGRDRPDHVLQGKLAGVRTHVGYVALHA